MKLSTGRNVVESEALNGSTFAEIEGGKEMTSTEWEEYCAIIKSLSLEAQRERIRNRLPGRFCVA